MRSTHPTPILARTGQCLAAAALGPRRGGTRCRTRRRSRTCGIGLRVGQRQDPQRRQPDHQHQRHHPHLRRGHDLPVQPQRGKPAAATDRFLWRRKKSPRQSPVQNRYPKHPMPAWAPAPLSDPCPSIRTSARDSSRHGTSHSPILEDRHHSPRIFIRTEWSFEIECQPNWLSIAKHPEDGLPPLRLRWPSSTSLWNLLRNRRQAGLGVVNRDGGLVLLNPGPPGSIGPKGLHSTLATREPSRTSQLLSVTRRRVEEFGGVSHFQEISSALSQRAPN